MGADYFIDKSVDFEKVIDVLEAMAKSNQTGGIE